MRILEKPLPFLLNGTGKEKLFVYCPENTLAQAIFFFLQNWEVLNTAVLTGQQVSQAMKVFIVSQAGKAADVTFQASCHSEDDNVLKVCNLRL